MILKFLELENIRSYIKEKIEFEEGINFLSGDIGSGKSSILQAIEFALFGFKRGDLEGSQLLRKGEREGSVKLCMGDSEQKIEIFRKIKKSKNAETISQENGYVVVGDNIVELSPQEINAQVFEFLNFPMEFLTKDKNLIYRFTIYTPQEQLKEVLFAENEKRLEVIRKIFDIDKYKQLKDAISIYMSKIREEKRFYEAKLEPLENIKNEIKKEEKEFIELKFEYERYLGKEKPLRDKSAKYKEALLKREEFLDKVREKSILIEKRLSQIDEIEKQNEKFVKDAGAKNTQLKIFGSSDVNMLIFERQKFITSKEKEIAQLLNEKEKTSLELKRFEFIFEEKQLYLKHLSEIENKKSLIKSQQQNFDYMLTMCQVRDLENILLRLKNKLKKHEKTKLDVEKQKTDLLRLEVEISNQMKKLSEIRFSIENLSAIKSCPTCLQQVSDEHKKSIMKIFGKGLVDEEKILKENTSQLQKLKVDKNNNNILLTEMELVEKKLVKAEEKLKFLKEKEKKEKVLNEGLKKLKKELKILEGKKVDKKLSELDEKLSEEKKLRKKLEDLNKKELEEKDIISKAKLALMDFENRTKEIKKLKNELFEIENKIRVNLVLLEKKEVYQQKLQDLSEKEKKLKVEKEKLGSVIDDIHEKDRLLTSKLSFLKAQIDAKKTYINEKDKIFQEIKKIQKDYEKLLYRENFLSGRVVNILELVEKMVFTKYYAQFNEEFERLFRQLIEDNDIEVRLDDEFSPIVEQNGYDIDMKNLSGGEKSSLAIAYRLGLKEIIDDNLGTKQILSLLILDEPTDGFSDEQVIRLGNILKESNLKQIILVSHDEKIESISDRVLHIEKINHVSSII